MGVRTKAALIDVAARFYPEARVSAKLRLSADALLAGGETVKAAVMQRPSTLVEVAEAARVGNQDFRIALAGFLDSFYTDPSRRQQRMIDAEPPLTGVQVTDAYLGAVGEHLARRWGRVIPPWTDDPRRMLDQPVFAGGIEALKAMLLVQSPLAFRRRMIFVEHEPLRRARMPISRSDGCSADSGKVEPA